MELQQYLQDHYHSGREVVLLIQGDFEEAVPVTVRGTVLNLNGEGYVDVDGRMLHLDRIIGFPEPGF